MNLARWADDWRRMIGSPWFTALMCGAFVWRAYLDGAAGHAVGAFLAVSGIAYTAVVTTALHLHPRQVTPPKNPHHRR